MDSLVNIYIKRSEDELILAKNDMSISIDKNTKNILGIPLEKTFFNSVISHSYYCIFYSAKAYLLSKGIKTNAPEEHKKTYDLFKKIASSGEIDKKLIKIYEEETIKAESLINIFFSERRKRGRFTYNIKSEANIPYAEESISNAKIFLSSIKFLIKGG